MLTQSDFTILKNFVAEPEKFSHAYGAAVLTGNFTKPVGTLILNSKTLKPIDYFISGENIGEYHYSRFRDIILTKKSIDGTAQTIVLPTKKLQK